MSKEVNLRTGNDKIRKINEEMRTIQLKGWDEMNKLDGTFKMKKEALDMLQGFVDEVDFLLGRVKLYNQSEIVELVPMLRNMRERFEMYHRQYGGVE